LYRYVIAGLTVVSDRRLPGVIDAPEDDGAADVSIAAAPTPTSLGEVSASGPTWEMSRGRFLFKVPGIARFLVSDGQEILYEVEEGGDLDDASVFLLGTAIGIVLHQRARLVLHASAVCVNGRAVVFCGRSGAGKSTLAAALNKRGYGLLLDDVCAVELVGGQPLAHPDGRQVKLWSEAINRLDLAERCAEPVRHRLEKFYVEPLGETPRTPIPIAVIYDLCEARSSAPAGVTRANVVDAALMLRRNFYRRALVEEMGLRRVAFQYAAALSAATGVFRLARPSQFVDMDEFIQGLEAHWIETGLMGSAG
jgi:hypothetical protein